MRTDPVSTAIAAAGSVTALARLLDINPQAVSQWKQVPAKHILKLERLINVPRHELREDLYPESDTPAQRAPAAAGQAASP